MKSVFYTSVTGPNNGYVHDVSRMQHPDFDFVAIHDSHHQPFPGWESINVDESYPHDIKRYAHKQRYARMMPHLYFSGYEYSVYLDPKWALTPDFIDLCAEQVARKKSWIMPTHPSRKNLVQEIFFHSVMALFHYRNVLRSSIILLKTIPTSSDSFPHLPAG